MKHIEGKQSPWLTIQETTWEGAVSLGIFVNQIYNWRTKFKKLSQKLFQMMDGVDYSRDELNEIRCLTYENAKLKEKLDFLKKLQRALPA